MDFRPPLSRRIGSMERAAILCDGYFGQNTGKTANGLVRYSKRYEITAVIDRTKAGRDAGDLLNGRPNGIPIVATLDDAIKKNQPKYLVINITTFNKYIPTKFRTIIQH